MTINAARTNEIVTTLMQKIDEMDLMKKIEEENKINIDGKSLWEILDDKDSFKTEILLSMNIIFIRGLDTYGVTDLSYQDLHEKMKAEVGIPENNLDYYKRNRDAYNIDYSLRALMAISKMLMYVHSEDISINRYVKDGCEIDEAVELYALQDLMIWVMEKMLDITINAENDGDGNTIISIIADGKESKITIDSDTMIAEAMLDDRPLEEVIKEVYDLDQEIPYNRWIAGEVENIYENFKTGYLPEEI